MKRDTIRMRLNTNCTSKLAFVKLIKEYTGMGLRDSKFVADQMFEDFQHKSTRWTEVSMLLPSKFSKLLELKNSLSEIGADCDMIGGAQWDRNYKMLELGIGEDDDYREFIREYVFANSEDYLQLIIDNVPKESLKEIFNVISQDIKKNYDSNC